MADNLTGEYISNTYQRVTQFISGTLFNGTGSQVTALGINMTGPAYNLDVYSAGSNPFRARSSNHTLYVGDGIYFQGYHYHFAQATTEKFRISMEGGATTVNLGIGMTGVNITPLSYAANYGYNANSPGTGPFLKVFSNAFPSGGFTSEWVGMYYSGSTGYLAAGSGSLALSSSIVSVTGSLRAGDITGTTAQFTHAILGEANVDKISINTYGVGDYRIRGFSYAGSLTLASEYLYGGGKIVLYGHSHSTNANNIYMTNRVGINVAIPTAVLDITGSSTTQASLRIRSGSAPSSPQDGDIWFDGVDLKMQIGGVTKTFAMTP